MEQETTQTPVISDEVIKEMEKISQIEKDIKSLNERTSIMYGDVSDLKEHIKKDADKKESKNVIKEENNDIVENDDKDGDKDENVVDKKLSQTLTSVEKERYKRIGEEFIKGVEEPIQKFKKAAELKEKMKTNVQVNKKEIKKDDKKVKKEKKSNWLKNMLLVIGTLGLAVVLFKDEIKKMFPDISSSISTNLGNLKTDLFDKFTQMFFNIATDGFGSLLGDVIKKDIPNVLRTLFFGIIPFTLEKSVLAVMSVFSSKAQERYEGMSSDVEIKVEQAQRTYDQAKMNQQANQDIMKVQSGRYSQSEMLTTLQRLSTSSIINYDQVKGLQGADSLQSTISSLYGSTLFGVTDQDSVKNFIFDENNPITRTLLGVMSDNNAELKATLQDGQLTEQELKETVIPLMAKAAGIDTDDHRYSDFEKNALQTFSNDAKRAATMMEHMLGAANQYSELSLKQKTQKIQDEAAAGAFERTAARAKITLSQLEPEKIKIKLEKASVDDDIAAEVHSFYVQIKKIFRGETIKETFSNNFFVIFTALWNYMYKKAFNMFDDIYKHIPSLFRENKSLSQILKHKVSFNQNDKANNVSAADFTSALANSDRPLVIVNIPISDSIVTRFTYLVENKYQNLETIQDTNTKLKDLITKLETIKKGNNGVLTQTKVEKMLTDVLSKNNLITEEQISKIDSRVGVIENYLEAQDGVDDDGKTKDFVLQATGS